MIRCEAAGFFPAASLIRPKGSYPKMPLKKLMKKEFL